MNRCVDCIYLQIGDGDTNYGIPPYIMCTKSMFQESSVEDLCDSLLVTLRKQHGCKEFKDYREERQ